MPDQHWMANPKGPLRAGLSLMVAALRHGPGLGLVISLGVTTPRHGSGLGLRALGAGVIVHIYPVREFEHFVCASSFCSVFSVALLMDSAGSVLVFPFAVARDLAHSVLAVSLVRYLPFFGMALVWKLCSSP